MDTIEQKKAKYSCGLDLSKSHGNKVSLLFMYTAGYTKYELSTKHLSLEEHIYLER